MGADATAYRQAHGQINTLHLPTITTAALTLAIAAAPTAGRADTGNQDTHTEQLDSIEISADTPSPYEPVDGYVAPETLSATKTRAPTTEVPQSVSVITSDRIEDRHADSLSETLAYTPGVSASPFGFEPRYTFIRMRGFEVTDNALYRDGLKLIAPPVVAGGSGTVVSYSLEPYGAQRIEVPRGPASVLYGQAAPGGLVNYVSKRPTNEPLRELTLELGTYAHAEARADFGGPIDTDGEFSYRLTGLARDSQTQVDFIQDDRLYLAPTFKWQPSASTSLTLLTHYQRDETKSSQAYPASGTLDGNPNGEIPRNRFTGDPDIDRYERTTTAAGYEFRHAFNDAVSFRQKLRYTSVDLDDESVYSAFVVDGRSVGRFYFGNFGELGALTVDNQFRFAFGGDTLAQEILAGIDYQDADLDSRQTTTAASDLDLYQPDYDSGVNPDNASAFADQTGGQEQLGFYLQDRITIADRWIATLGGRYDEASRTTNNQLAGTANKQDDSEFTARAGLVYRADNGLSPYLSYSESFLPALGNGPDGNPFEPELGTQYEVGVKYQPPGTNALVTLALYDLTRENYITSNPANGFVNRQVGEAQSRGVELSGTASLATGLNVVASYSYADVEITESSNTAEEGQRPEQTPEHQASLWTKYAFQSPQLEGLGVGAGVRYIGSTYADAANTVRIPDVTLLDAAVTYDVGGYRFALNASNALDKTYEKGGFQRAGTTFTNYGRALDVVASVRYRW